MSNQQWNIKELLSPDEIVFYECTITNDEASIHVYLTNYRIIWISGNFVDSRLLKFISKYGVFVGYEEYSEDADKGEGDYGVYFGDTDSYETLWFYSENVWKTFYNELSRCILEYSA